MPKLTVIFENDFGFITTVSYEGLEENEVSEYLSSDRLMNGLGFYTDKMTKRGVDDGGGV